VTTPFAKSVSSACASGKRVGNTLVEGLPAAPHALRVVPYPSRAPSPVTNRGKRVFRPDNKCDCPLHFPPVGSLMIR